jgi:hypothetical protein
MFGISEEQLAEFGMTFGLGAFMLYMLFIIGELAWKSKAGKLGTFVLFFVWPSACSASSPSSSSRKCGVSEMSAEKNEFDNVSVVKKANVYFDGKCVSHTVRLPTARRRASASSCRPR